MGRKFGAVPLLGELGLHLTQCRLAEAYPRTKWHLDPCRKLGTEVAIHGPKLGVLCCLFFAEAGPHLTQCRLGEVYLRTKRHLNPSSRLATTDIG